jgi:hypothetical protein
MGNAMAIRGIDYDTGTNYAPGYLSRVVWHDAMFQAEIDTIRDQLHCNAVMLYGSEIDRLVACAAYAARRGLHVWLQPRLIDSTAEAMLAHLGELAVRAEQLRQQGGQVTLNVGCELSIFMGGLMPGRDFMRRIQWLKRFWWLYMPLPHYRHRLNQHLRAAVAVVRSAFGGPVTYGAGIWESVDWTAFDLVGLNYYRESSNWGSYAQELRRFHRFNKPIVITEFGCCSFPGADRLGGSGDSIVDYEAPVRQLKRPVARDEQVQSNYIADLLHIYRDEGIHGAFVFEFTEPSHPYSPDSLFDLDIASYGIVKVLDEMEPHRWQPKLAFHRMAQVYADMASNA